MTPPPSSEALLDPEFIKRIERLSLVSRRLLAGRLKGDRRSKRKGVSVEFADYKDYVPGDDIRFVDWNIYGRLDRLFLKLFVEEEDLSLQILVDQSGSMDHGDPNKGLYARRVAAALAYIGLAGGDRVVVGTFGNGLASVHGPARGKRSIWPLLRFLERTAPQGGTDLAVAFKTFVQRHRRPGIGIVVSDFFDKAGLDGALGALLASRSDLFALHVLAPEEVHPQRSLAGDLLLVDCEDGDQAEITLSAPLLEQYSRTLAAFCAEVRDRCTRRSIQYLFATTDIPFDRLILEYIRGRGLLK